MWYSFGRWGWYRRCRWLQHPPPPDETTPEDLPKTMKVHAISGRSDVSVVATLLRLLVERYREMGGPLSVLQTDLVGALGAVRF